MQLEFSSYVYFVVAQDQDLVKIGTSGNPYTRISHLKNRYGWDMHLLGCLQDEHNRGRSLLRGFKARGYCVFGDWFRYGPLAEEIEKMLPPGPARFPRKLSREEIVLRAELRWATSDEERTKAARAIAARERDPSLSVEEAKRIVASEDNVKRRYDVFAKFYGPKNQG